MQVFAKCRPWAVTGVCLYVISTWAAVAETAAPTPRPPDTSVPGREGDLTLAEALARTLAGNPELSAAHLDMAISEARRLQAALRKNPDLSLEIEDVRWRRGPDTYGRSNTVEVDRTGVRITGDASREQGAAPGFAEAQITLRLSQLIELGGKRVKRLRVAEKEEDLVRWNYEAKRLDILTEVAKLFIEVLNAQEKLELAEEDVDIAQRVVSTVQARVKAGKVSPIEAQKAQNELSARIIAKDRESSMLENARTSLAAAWGAKRPDFKRAVGDYYTTLPVPLYDELEAGIKGNPDLARWADEMELRQALLMAQRAQGMPDLTVELGFRTIGYESHEQESQSFSSDWVSSFSSGETGFGSRRDNSLVVLFSLPVPLFDRNQGGIKEAEHEAEKAVQLKRKAEVDVESALHAAHKSLVHAEGRVASLKNRVLPQAQDILAKTEEGYRQGKFSYLEVLDAQRSLYELTAQYVDALKDYHDAVADVERLSGRSVFGAEPDFEPRENKNGTDP